MRKFTEQHCSPGRTQGESKLKLALLIASILLISIPTHASTLGEKWVDIPLTTSTVTSGEVTRVSKSGNHSGFSQNLSNSDVRARSYKNISVTLINAKRVDGESRQEALVQIDAIAHGFCTQGKNKGISLKIMNDDQELCEARIVAKGQGFESRLFPFHTINTWFTVHYLRPFTGSSFPVSCFTPANKVRLVANSDLVQSC